MLRFATDEDFNGDILRALRRRAPDIDIIRTQDAGLRGADDPTVLKWAAEQGRILVTHDVSTMTHHALQRVLQGHPMPGLIAVHQRLPIGAVVDDLLLVARCSSPEEWSSVVSYLPLR